MNKTAIGWTHADGYIGTTLNWATGCTMIGVPSEHQLTPENYALNPEQIPSECSFCYMMLREYDHMKILQANRGIILEKQKYRFQPTTPHLFPFALDEAWRWNKPHMVFPNSMGDTFHESTPFEWLLKYWMPIVKAKPEHLWLPLTKRPYRMAQFAELIHGFPKNVWAGTSVGHPAWVHRLDQLGNVIVNSGIRFWSCEPLLESFEGVSVAEIMRRNGIKQIIIGGESGEHLRDPKWQHRALVRLDAHGEWVPREDRIGWVRYLINEARKADAAVFLKQWGGPRPKSAGNQLDGKTIEEYPM